MADWTIKIRPDNLTRLKPEAVAGKEPPVTLPEKSPAKIEATVKWAEACIDHHEKEGDLLTGACLCEYAKETGIGVDEMAELIAQIKEVYPNGNGSKKVGTSPAKATKAVKKKEKPAMVKKTDKGKPNKPAAKASKNGNGNGHAKNGNGNGKHSNGNGAKDKVKNGNGAKGKPTRKKEVVGKVLVDTKVSGCPVHVEVKNDKIVATVFDVPIRGVMRFYGKNKVSIAKAREAGILLLRDMKKGNARFKNGEELIKQIVADGHVTSGANGDSGVFGPVPKFKKDQAALLLKLAK